MTQQSGVKLKVATMPNVISVARTLEFKIGEVFQLAEADWNFKFPPGKSTAALTGLAIDKHIKSFLSKTKKDICTPLSQYAPYDLLIDGVFFDIKSTSGTSVSISADEIAKAKQVLADGSDMVYLVFEQRQGQAFIFRGFILYSLLEANNKLQKSQYSGSYFTLNDSFIRGSLIE